MKRKIETDYERHLDQLIDEVFTMAVDQFDWSWSQFAKEARLAATTVAKIGNRLTRFPEYRTIYRLAKAVGMEMRLANTSTKRKVA